MPSAAEVLALEEVCYDVWRAPDVEEVDGWRLRFANGLTGRANSVWPNGDGLLPLDERIERVEAWYAARGAAPRFQLTRAARPPGLDDALVRRGYEQSGNPVSVETASVGDVVARTFGDADVGERLDDGWLRVWLAERGTDDEATARALETGAAGRTAYASVGVDAIGSGVVVVKWLGIVAMYTRAAVRRRGHARAIL